MWWQSGKKIPFLFRLLSIYYEEFAKGSVSEFQSSGFRNFQQLKAILLWLKTEVSTQAGCKLPTEGIGIFNYIQSPSKFSQMEICLYPYLLSPGDDMCFIHYESSSPGVSAKGKGEGANVLVACTMLGSAYDIRRVTNKMAMWKIWFTIWESIPYLGLALQQL